MSNPIAAWTGCAGTGGVSYFGFDGQVLATSLSLPPQLRETGQDMVRELVDWRLTEYLRRTANGRGADTFVARVNQASGRPIVFQLPRDTVPGIPEGWVDLVADDQEYQANFIKVALNVVVRPGSQKNVLPDIL